MLNQLLTDALISMLTDFSEFLWLTDAESAAL